MRHSVAVGTEQDQIDKVCRFARNELRHGLRVVALDEPRAPLTITLVKVEPAGLAAQVNMLQQV